MCRGDLGALGIWSSFFYSISCFGVLILKPIPFFSSRLVPEPISIQNTSKRTIVEEMRGQKEKEKKKRKEKKKKKAPQTPQVPKQCTRKTPVVTLVGWQ